MKAILLPILLALTCHATAQKKDYWQQKVDYNITVNLDAGKKTLDGTCDMQYHNNSHDTLRFIWIHLWPNAYKNDKTAFSEQLLKLGRTDFYFSNEVDRGYINRLNFKVGGVTAKMIDHPQHQDIIKVILPVPLAPGASVDMTTPFHVKLPKIFSRSGYRDSSFQIAQWYPKPAVYDAAGWHEMPYLDQGEFYSELGSFKVSISLPSEFVLAATGNLTAKNTEGNITRYEYSENNIHDFAWFADKSFILKSDSLQGKDGIITINNYVLPGDEDTWKKSIEFTKRAILTKEKWVGAYPFKQVSIVDNVAAKNGGGMEYPTIAVLGADNESDLEDVINHEVGHNWFHGIIANNERTYPWMDEGINSFYDKKYKGMYDSSIVERKKNVMLRKLPAMPEKTLLQTLVFLHKDQPINTSSEKFSFLNYNLIAYEKAAEWMKRMETKLGEKVFEEVMHAYYDKWKFKHPYPQDFKAIAEDKSGQNLTHFFSQLHSTGFLVKDVKPVIKPTFLFNLNQSRRTNYISFLPAAGYNFYDKFMIGGLVHNYNLPPTKFQFAVAPLYATGSKQINGIGRVSYTFFPQKDARKLSLFASFSHFTADDFKDSTGKRNYQPFTKFAPGFRYTFGNTKPLSSIERYVQLKAYFIEETELNFSRDTVRQLDVISYPKARRQLNQLVIGVNNYRVLYPYQAELTAEQGKNFLRFNLTGNYFFNYAKSGGFNVRLFAGKFIYTGNNSFTTQFETDRYHLNLSGPKGYEDYTYTDYFYGRNEFDGFAARQIMERDGYFKVKTDFLSNKIGRSDDWLAAINLNTSIPSKINPLSLLPFKIPISLFADIGTYAEAWDRKTAGTSRFLFDAGVQVNLFLDVVKVYFPIIYSKVYSNYFKSTIPGSTFKNNIVFSINFKNLTPRKIYPALGL